MGVVLEQLGERALGRRRRRLHLRPQLGRHRGSDLSAQVVQTGIGDQGADATVATGRPWRQVAAEAAPRQHHPLPVDVRPLGREVEDRAEDHLIVRTEHQALVGQGRPLPRPVHHEHRIAAPGATNDVEGVVLLDRGVVAGHGHHGRVRPGRGSLGTDQAAGQRRPRVRHRHQVDIDTEVVEPRSEAAPGRLPRRAQESSGQVHASKK